MWSDPVIRTPASGLPAAYFSRIAIRPGISCSAIWISLRPHSARLMSATLKSVVAADWEAVVVGMGVFGWRNEELR